MKALKYYIVALACLGAVIPLIFLVDFSWSYVFVQTRSLYLIADLSLMPLVVLWLWSPETRPRLHGLTLTFAAFVISLVLVNIFSLQPLKSYLGVWERFGGVIGYVHLFIFFLMLITALRDWTAWQRYLRWVVAVSLAVVLYGWAQQYQLFGVYTSGGRIFSTTGNPAFLASYVLLTMGLAVFLTLRDKVKLWRFFYVLVIALSLPVIWWTQTRAVLLSLSFVVAGLLLWRISHIRLRKQGVILWVSLLLVVTSAALLLVLSTDFGKRWCRAVARQDCGLVYHISSQTMVLRLLNWPVALSGLSARPVFGWGDENFNLTFNRYFTPALYQEPGPDQWYDRAHNQYLDRLVMGGVVGFAFFAAWLLEPLILWWRRRRDEGSTYLFVLSLWLAAYYLYLLFFFNSISDSVVFVIYLGLIYSLDIEPHRRQDRRLSKLVTVTAVIISVGLGFMINASDVVANYYIGRGEQAQELKMKLAYWQRAWPLSHNGQRLITMDLQDLQPYVGVEGRDRLELYDIQRQWSAEVLSRYPFDLPYILILIRSYEALSDINTTYAFQGFDAATAALTLSPERSTLYHLRGRMALLLSDLEPVEEKLWRERALADFTRAYASGPKIIDNILYYEIVREIVNGRSGYLQPVIDERYEQLSLVNWNDVINYYYRYKDPSGLASSAALLEKRMLEYRQYLEYPQFYDRYYQVSLDLERLKQYAENLEDQL